jgi:selenocysteine lyase/cysteine desulfurase
VIAVPPPPAHPGTDGYVELFAKAFTPRTKVLAINYVSSNSGDMLPVAALCRLARERGALSLVDSAQAFGVIDVNLSEVKPDFFTGSMHKWPCGPKEKGVLFVNRAVHDRIAPSVYGVYGGAVGSRARSGGRSARRRVDGAVVEALKFRGHRACANRKARSRTGRAPDDRALKLDGVHCGRTRHRPICRDRDLQAGRARPQSWVTCSEKERIVVTVRAANGSILDSRVPHMYNTMDDIDRFVATIAKYMKTGV